MSGAAKRRVWRLAVPLAVFVALAAGLLQVVLDPPADVPESALTGRTVPEFSLPPIDGTGTPGFSSADLAAGRVTVVNFWASWCGPCRAEHPLLERLAERDDLQVSAIAYKDSSDGARAFLREEGNPFTRLGLDADGRVGIEWGLFGVPETFVVNGRGVIVFHHPGPLYEEALERLVAAAERANDQ